jgi:hypothetical protein
MIVLSSFANNFSGTIGNITNDDYFHFGKTVYYQLFSKMRKRTEANWNFFTNGIINNNYVFSTGRTSTSTLIRAITDFSSYYKNIYDTLTGQYPLLLLSGSSSTRMLLLMGRTTDKAVIGISGATNSVIPGDVAGDMDFVVSNKSFSWSVGSSTLDMKLSNAGLGVGTGSPLSPQGYSKALHVAAADASLVLE